MDLFNTFVAENSTSTTTTTATTKVEKSTEADFLSGSEAGTLLIGGCLEFESMTAKQPEGLETYRVVDLGSPVRKSFSSASSMHLFVLLVNGKLFSQGLNANGQLGHNDLVTRRFPIEVRLPVDSTVVKVACGRYHSLILFSNGEVYGCGLNKCGQLGLGDGKAVMGDIKVLMKLPLKDIRDIDAGHEHSIACDSSGRMYTWGSPVFGQLGHGTTGEYLKEGGKGKALQHDIITTPRLVSRFVTKDIKGRNSVDIPANQIRVRLVAAGKNHSACVEDWEGEGQQGRVFTWGFGGLGRLGHNAPDDELLPRELLPFTPSTNAGAKPNPQRQIRQLQTGSTCTTVISESQHLYFFGKLSNSSRGEAQMYPKLVDDLYNWKSKHMSLGSNLVVVAAEDKVVAWGAPVAGLLGFDGGGKSSITPKFLTCLVV
jgi:alpha-tubulin suppressor-like RCC1 family protein